jgi:S-adenosylmethionine synthetase
VRRSFDFRPRSIIEALGLRAPIFGASAAYGHFGRTPETVTRFGREVELFTWERTDHAEELRDALGL